MRVFAMARKLNVSKAYLRPELAFGVLGLSFKAGTGDLSESPRVGLVETLIEKGCDVRILDRNVATARLMGANRRYIDEEIPLTRGHATRSVTRRRAGS